MRLYLITLTAVAALQKGNKTIIDRVQVVVYNKLYGALRQIPTAMSADEYEGAIATSLTLDDLAEESDVGAQIVLSGGGIFGDDTIVYGEEGSLLLEIAKLWNTKATVVVGEDDTLIEDATAEDYIGVPLKMSPPTSQYTMIDTEIGDNKYRIGVIGVSNGFNNTVNEVNDLVELVAQDEKANAIVVLCNEGFDSVDLLPPSFSQFLQTLDERVTIVSTAHSHYSYHISTDNGRQVGQARGYGRGLSVFNLDFDRDTHDLTETSGKVINVAHPIHWSETQNKWIDASSDNEDHKHTASVSKRTNEVKDIVMKAMESAAAHRAQRLTSYPQPIPLNDIIADSFVWGAKQVEPNVQYGIVLPHPTPTINKTDGVTYGNVWEALPYPTPLVTVTLNGTEIVNYLTNTIVQSPPLYKLQVSGFRFDYIPLYHGGNPSAARISDLRDELTGAKLQPDAEYRLVTQKFSFDGDNSLCTATSPGRECTELGITDNANLIHYLQQNDQNILSQSYPVRASQPSHKQLRVLNPIKAEETTYNTQIEGTTNSQSTTDSAGPDATDDAHSEPDATDDAHTGPDATDDAHSSPDATDNAHTEPDATDDSHTEPDATDVHTSADATDLHTIPDVTDLQTGPDATEDAHTEPDATDGAHTEPDATDLHTGPDATDDAHTEPDATDLHTGPDATDDAHTEPDATDLQTGPDATDDAHTGPDATDDAHTEPDATDDSHTEPDATDLRTGPDTTDDSHTEPDATDLRTAPDATDDAHTGPDATDDAHTGPDATDDAHTDPDATDDSHTEPDATDLQTSPDATDDGHTEPDATDLQTGPDATDDAHTGPDATDDTHTGPDATDDAHTGPDATDDAHTGPDATDDAHTEPDATDDAHTEPDATDLTDVTGPDATDDAHTGPDATDDAQTGSDATDDAHTGSDSTDDAHTEPDATDLHTSPDATDDAHTEPEATDVHTSADATDNFHTGPQSTDELHGGTEITHDVGTNPLDSTSRAATIDGLMTTSGEDMDFADEENGIANMAVGFLVLITAVVVA